MSEPCRILPQEDCPEEVQRLMAEHPLLRACILVVPQQIGLVQALQDQVHKLQGEVKTLSDRLNLDSHNSHKPSGSDQGRPPKSLRSTSDRLPGA